MYLLKVTYPDARSPLYLSEYVGWTNYRKNARRYKAEEVIPKYQEIAAEFRTSRYTLELERVED